MNNDWTWFIFWGAAMLIVEAVGFIIESRRKVK
jgi:hypothetical protein